MSLFSGFEISQMRDLQIFADLRAVFAGLWMEMNAAKSGFAMLLRRRIGGILTARRVSQVLQSIVGTITVAMINLIVWPFAVDIEPRKTMR